MRTAYSGRAAAYEKKSDFRKALADHKMVTLFFAIEGEILNGSESAGRAKFLLDSAGAYRARGSCLEALGQSKEAAADRKRADDLYATAQKLEAGAKNRPGTASAIQIKNAWTQPVSLVIAGTTHRLEVGEEKAIPTPPGAVPYEMEMGAHRSAGTLQTGRTYTIRTAP